MRGGGLVVEGMVARLHLRGRPVGARQVQALVLGVAGAAQPAVRDLLLGPAAGVAVPDRVPVVERLGAAGLHGRLARRRPGVLRALREAGGDPADRVRHRPVRGGRGRGEHGERQGGDADQGDHGGLATNGHRGGLLHEVHQVRRVRGGGAKAEVGGRDAGAAVPPPVNGAGGHPNPPCEQHASRAEQRIRGPEADPGDPYGRVKTGLSGGTGSRAEIGHRGPGERVLGVWRAPPGAPVVGVGERGHRSSGSAKASMRALAGRASDTVSRGSSAQMNLPSAV